MIRSTLYRNALSVVLFIVAVAGIVQQIHEIKVGLILPQARLTLIAYILIAIYAAASVALRLRGSKAKK